VTELRKAMKANGLSECERKLTENMLEKIKQFGQMGAKAQELYEVCPLKIPYFSFNNFFS